MGNVLSLIKPAASVWPSTTKARDPIIQLLSNLSPVQLEGFVPKGMHMVASEVAELLIG